MSTPEMVRFANDVRTDNDMLTEILEFGADQDRIMRLANDRGYNVTDSDIDELLQINPKAAPDKRSNEAFVAVVVLVVAVFVWVV